MKNKLNYEKLWKELKSHLLYAEKYGDPLTGSMSFALYSVMEKMEEMEEAVNAKEEQHIVN